MKKMTLAACVAAVTALSGCSMFDPGNSLVAPLVREDAEMKDFSNIEPGELKAVREYADKYASLLLKAIVEDDYKKISPFLAPPLKKKLTEKAFTLMADRLKETSGSPDRMQHFGELKQGLFATSVYKVELKKKGKKGTVVNDGLLRMSIGRLDGNYLIWNVFFD